MLAIHKPINEQPEEQLYQRTKRTSRPKRPTAHQKNRPPPPRHSPPPPPPPHHSPPPPPHHHRFPPHHHHHSPPPLLHNLPHNPAEGSGYFTVYSVTSYRIDSSPQTHPARYVPYRYTKPVGTGPPPPSLMHPISGMTCGGICNRTDRTLAKIGPTSNSHSLPGKKKPNFSKPETLHTLKTSPPTRRREVNSLGPAGESPPSSTNPQ